jgi:hypothetical protein
MFQKSKITRTQIADLPEINVELSDRELRIVSGGLRPVMNCVSRVPVKKSSFSSGTATDYNTSGDHDPD